jgi:K+-transporting ATPase ATPase A chain
LVSQNFLAGAAGLAVGIAFIRGFVRERSATLSNFWVDLARGLLWVLLPLALAGSLVLVWQGVPINLAPYTEAFTLEGRSQAIAQGPAAAYEFIKNLGTKGGGLFNANGAHPYENPTPLVNFLALLAIAVLPASLTVTFGQMTGRPRAGRIQLALMVLLFVGGLAVCDYAEATLPPQLAALSISGSDMEGGSYNSMYNHVAHGEYPWALMRAANEVRIVLLDGRLGPPRLAMEGRGWSTGLAMVV